MYSDGVSLVDEASTRLELGTAWQPSYVLRVPHLYSYCDTPLSMIAIYMHDNS